MKIEIGDQVLCIDAFFHSLVKGRIYKVFGISSCRNCGAIVLDVGLKFNKPEAEHNCTKCSSKSINENSMIHYAYSSRFIKIDNLLKNCQWEKGKDELKEMTKEQWEYLLRDQSKKRRECLKKIFNS